MCNFNLNLIYCKKGDIAILDPVTNKIRCGGAWFDFDERWIIEEKEWWEGHAATIWWESLSLEEQHDKVYHYCIMQEISTMEFSMEDVVNIWKHKTISE